MCELIEIDGTKYKYGLRGLLFRKSGNEWIRSSFDENELINIFMAKYLSHIVKDETDYYNYYFDGIIKLLSLKKITSDFIIKETTKAISRQIKKDYKSIFMHRLNKEGIKGNRAKDMFNLVVANYKYDYDFCNADKDADNALLVTI